MFLKLQSTASICFAGFVPIEKRFILMLRGFLPASYIFKVCASDTLSLYDKIKSDYYPLQGCQTNYTLTF